MGSTRMPSGRVCLTTPVNGPLIHADGIMGLALCCREGSLLHVYNPGRGTSGRRSDSRSFPRLLGSVHQVHLHFAAQLMGFAVPRRPQGKRELSRLRFLFSARTFFGDSFPWAWA